MIASEILPQEFNVATYFVDRNVAEGRGGRPAFLYEDRVLTYGDVQDLANRTGNALLELGVQPEDRVLLLCLDAPEFLGTFWGAIKIGAVPIPVNTLMRAADYVYFLRRQPRQGRRSSRRRCWRRRARRSAQSPLPAPRARGRRPGPLASVVGGSDRARQPAR